jgi:hypothetical protein
MIEEDEWPSHSSRIFFDRGSAHNLEKTRMDLPFTVINLEKIRTHCFIIQPNGNKCSHHKIMNLAVSDK